MANNDEEMAEIERIFKRVDTNGNGKISLSELGDVLRLLGSVSPDEIQRVMSEIDTDRDGCIDFKEFTAFHQANRGLMKDVSKILWFLSWMVDVVSFSSNLGTHEWCLALVFGIKPTDLMLFWLIMTMYP